jgi:hypothetical protein
MTGYVSITLNELLLFAACFVHLHKPIDRLRNAPSDVSL